MTPPTREQIEQTQSAKLRALLTGHVPHSPFWTRKLAGCDLAAVRRAADLPSLPLCTKQELVEDQAAHPPFGTVLTKPASAYNRVHQTSGTTGEPLRWLDDAAGWAWFGECWEQIYRLAGLTRSTIGCSSRSASGRSSGSGRRSTRRVGPAGSPSPAAG